MAEHPSSIFNDSSPDWTSAGGNSQVMNVNIAFSGSVGHQVWILIAGCMIMPIVPGMGLFYAGETRRKSAMTVLWQTMAVLGLVPFQWFFWGYSLTYSPDASPFIGTLKAFGLRNVIAVPNGYLPEILFCFFQGMFCIETMVIMVGGCIERCRPVPSIVFAICWATVVYCPVACWTWNANGWLYTLGALDFAGGGPVHIASGTASLAIALFLGPRIRPDGTKREIHHYSPHSPLLIYIGIIFIWFGWFGFNGGSTLNATVRSFYAVANTNLAAATGILGWCVVDYIMYKGRFSVAGCCRGVMVGLVAITPGAGFVPIYFAAVIGFTASAIVRSMDDWLNKFIGIDDGIMVFKNHAIGGIAGAVMTGLFAANWVTSLDGFSSASGWIDGNYVQLAYQIAECCAITTYSFIVSLGLLYIINLIPGLHVRSTEQEELDGLDAHYLFNEGTCDHELYRALKEGGVLDAMIFRGRNILAERNPLTISGK
ncbi:ammonium transporter AmtB-like domain-containing protein [Lipomyces oligophaga]|uniref:ammonium transporter AmtB-like domain-containing protein n=1 Tax=Lipomyces oligophaga TaxID=45792 RepID=UPI0034CD9D0A